MPRGSGSKHVTTWSRSKISRTSRSQKRSKNRNTFRDAKELVHHFWRDFCDRCRRNREKRARFACEQGRQTKAARARPRERDWPALRLLSAMAKESAAIKARAWCRFVQRPCAGDRGPGLESKLCGA